MTHLITPPVGDTQYNTPSDSPPETPTVTMLTRILRASSVFRDDVHAQGTDSRIELHTTTDAHDAWVDIFVDDTLFTDTDTVTGEHTLPLARIADLTRVCRNASTAVIRINTDTNRITLLTPKLTYNVSLFVTTNVPYVLTRPDHDRPMTFHATGDALNAPLTLAERLTNRVKLTFEPASRQLTVTAAGSDESLLAEYTVPTSDDLPSEQIETVVSLDRLLPVIDVIPDAARMRVAFGNASSVRITYEVGDVADIAFTLRATSATLSAE